MRTVLSILLASLVHLVAAAQEPGAEYFRSQSISITITASVQGKGGKFTPYAVTQLTYDGKTGHIYERILRPDLIPRDWGLGTNLFFDHGKVTEENYRDKAWTSYRCTGKEFVDFVYYLYAGAGLFTEIAQEGLARDRDYNTSETTTTVVICPKPGSNASEIARIMIVRKAKPQLILEFTYSDPPKKQIFRESFAYDAGDLVDWSKVHPPNDAPEIKNPLPGRMVYP